MRFWWQCLVSLAMAVPVGAQVAVTGTVRLKVEESMGPVGDALVRVVAPTPPPVSTTTNADGEAWLVLPSGEVVLLVARIGYVPRRVKVQVPMGGEIAVSVLLEMEMKMTEVEEITVSAARTERLAGETPVRVEVISPMQVDERTQMAPSGIAMQLSDVPGVRVQSASASLGTGGVRIFGLPGQYTAILADGLPLYGGASSALGPLDISPVDLQRVEILKGPSSALYGGQALGGVVNLISKPPTGRNEVLVNQRTRDVTDGATWLSRRFSDASGVSLLLSGTRQGAEDVDRDGWGDQPRARRWNVRPRFARIDSAGRALFVTAGFGYDDRAGGTFGAALAPDGEVFRERLTGRRADLGVSAKLPMRNGGNVAIRSALSTNGRDRFFGAGPVERDRTSTGFLEVTRSTVSTHAATVWGAVVQADGYRNRINDAFDHTWVTPGLFVTGERDVGPVTLSGSLRGDRHPTAGMRVTERMAALIRPAPQWSLRASAGTGYAPATPLIEETEAIGLRAIRAGAPLRYERSVGATIDLNGRVGAVELLFTGYGSQLRDQVQLAPAGDSTTDGTLMNAAGPTQIGGVEAAAVWRFRGGKLYLNYGFADGTRIDPATGERGPVPLLPRHRVGADLMFERPGVYRIGLEGTLYGSQALVDDPYRTRSKPYLYTMFIAVRQIGAVEVVANFENLLNVRQTDYEPLVLPAPMTGGRWTTDVWAPLEGFLANAAVRYRW